MPTAYQTAIANVAKRIKEARPAIKEGDPVPVFNMAACAVILSVALEVERDQVMHDLVAAAARTPARTMGENCTCYLNCGEDTLSESWHQHENDPCPEHPDAPMVG